MGNPSDSSVSEVLGFQIPEVSRRKGFLKASKVGMDFRGWIQGAKMQSLCRTSRNMRVAEAGGFQIDMFRLFDML